MPSRTTSREGEVPVEPCDSIHIASATTVRQSRKKVARPLYPYKEMFRLRGLPYNGKCKKPQYIGHLTNDLVYSRLAPGVLTELRKRNPRSVGGIRKSKHHQWLTDDIGHPKLLQHLAAVTALMRGHTDWDSFYEMLDRSLKKWTKLPLWDATGASPD